MWVALNCIWCWLVVFVLLPTCGLVVLVDLRWFWVVFFAFVWVYGWCCYCSLWMFWFGCLTCLVVWVDECWFRLIVINSKYLYLSYVSHLLLSFMVWFYLVVGVVCGCFGVCFLTIVLVWCCLLAYFICHGLVWLTCCFAFFCLLVFCRLVVCGCFYLPLRCGWFRYLCLLLLWCLRFGCLVCYYEFLVWFVDLLYLLFCFVFARFALSLLGCFYFSVLCCLDCGSLDFTFVSVW